MRVKHRIEPLLKFVIFMSAKRYKSIKSVYNYLITHPWTDAFKPGATLDAMLYFLYKKGDYEYVGGYFGNIQMESYVDNTDDFMHTYLKRNRCESHNSFLKEHLDLERNVPKGKKKVKFHISLCIIVVQVVALARIQNGITEQIGRHTFLT